MAKRVREINPGGINGTGKGTINTNSKDFVVLRQKVLEHAMQLSPKEKLKVELTSLKFRMESYAMQESPEVIVEVCQFLRDHLIAIEVTNRQFAKYLRIEESNLSSILKGKRKINIDLAFKLGQVFGLDPNIWLMIQSKNEILKLAQKKKLRYRKLDLDDLLKKVS